MQCHHHHQLILHLEYHFVIIYQKKPSLFSSYSKKAEAKEESKIANATKTSSQYSNVMYPPFSFPPTPNPQVSLVTQEENILMPRGSSHRTS